MRTNKTPLLNKTKVNILIKNLQKLNLGKNKKDQRSQNIDEYGEACSRGSE
tara:strand:+ start:62 stop:214 length:153 start_codon:yes stop_codon:yes gene_type:complete